ncbi:peptidoglycan DD-metalloendopeptidase family protein [Bacteroidales bacterium OttesenSCG-928-M11]|nr:peptidoglycan DD-metalloendopeptidase family protein [Bacteroidales bacterium OttesenSCG-928-M11]
MKAKIFLLFLLIPVFGLAQNKNIQELEKKRAKIQEDIKFGEAAIQETEKNRGSKNLHLNLIREQIKSRLEMIKTLDQEVVAMNQEIAHKERQIQHLEKELNKKKQNYAETVESMYVKRNQSNRLLFILSANDFSQALRRIVYLKEYSNFHKTQAEEIARNQSILAAEKLDLEKNKERKLSLLSTRKEEENKLNNEEKNLVVEVKNLQTQKKQIQAEIAKKQKEDLALKKEIDRIIAEEIAKAEAARKAREAKDKEKPENGTSSAKTQTSISSQKTKEDLALSANFGENKSKLPFPIKGNYRIINKFGRNQSNTSPLHDYKGIDLLVLKGTEALCIFDGEVIYTGVFSNYCRVVLVQHGKYYTLYQNLDKVYVKMGEKVKKGQALGTVYTDLTKGDGTILHFEIHENKKALNPELWLNK